MATTSSPRCRAMRYVARMAAFMPGASPPLVMTPIRLSLIFLSLPRVHSKLFISPPISQQSTPPPPDPAWLPHSRDRPPDQALPSPGDPPAALSPTSFPGGLCVSGG